MYKRKNNIKEVEDKNGGFKKLWRGEGSKRFLEGCLGVF